MLDRSRDSSRWKLLPDLSSLRYEGTGRGLLSPVQRVSRVKVEVRPARDVSKRLVQASQTDVCTGTRLMKFGKSTYAHVFDISITFTDTVQLTCSGGESDGDTNSDRRKSNRQGRQVPW